MSSENSSIRKDVRRVIILKREKGTSSECLEDSKDQKKTSCFAGKKRTSDSLSDESKQAQTKRACFFVQFVQIVEVLLQYNPKNKPRILCLDGENFFHYWKNYYISKDFVRNCYNYFLTTYDFIIIVGKRPLAEAENLLGKLDLTKTIYVRCLMNNYHDYKPRRSTDDALLLSIASALDQNKATTGGIELYSHDTYDDLDKGGIAIRYSVTPEINPVFRLLDNVFDPSKHLSDSALTFGRNNVTSFKYINVDTVKKYNARRVTSTKTPSCALTSSINIVLTSESCKVNSSTTVNNLTSSTSSTKVDFSLGASDSTSKITVSKPLLSLETSLSLSSSTSVTMNSSYNITMNSSSEMTIATASSIATGSSSSCPHYSTE